MLNLVKNLRKSWRQKIKSIEPETESEKNLKKEFGKKFEPEIFFGLGSLEGLCRVNGLT